MRIRRTHLIIMLILLIEASLGLYIGSYTFRNKRPVWTYHSDDEITSISAASSGSLIGIGGKNGSISLVSRGMTTPLWRYRGESEVYSIMSSTKGGYFVTLDSNDTISLFTRTPHLKGGHVHPLWTYHLPAGKIEGFYSSGGIPPIVYVLASSGGKIHLLSKNGEMLWEYHTEADDVMTTLSENGLWIVTGDPNGEVLLFSVNSPKPKWTFPTASRVTSLAISFNDKYIVVGGAADDGRGEIHLLSRADGGPVFQYGVDSPIRSVHISHDGGRIISVEEDGTGLIISHDGGDVHEKAFNVPKGISSIKIPLFSSYMVSSNPEGEIYLSFIPRPAPLWKFNPQDEDPHVAVTRNGENIYVAGSNDVHLLSNTSLTEMIPGSRIGWAVFFFLGVAVAFLSVVKKIGGLKLAEVDRGDYTTVLIGFIVGTSVGLILSRDLSKAVLLSGFGSAVGSFVGWRGRRIISFISGCYLGILGSGIAGALLGLLIWFDGDERSIIQLVLANLFDGLKTGVLFGPLGAAIGTFLVGLIVPKIFKTSRLVLDS